MKAPLGYKQQRAAMITAARVSQGLYKSERLATGTECKSVAADRIVWAVFKYMGPNAGAE